MKTSFILLHSHRAELAFVFATAHSNPTCFSCDLRARSHFPGCFSAGPRFTVLLRLALTRSLNSFDSLLFSTPSFPVGTSFSFSAGSFVYAGDLSNIILGYDSLLRLIQSSDSLHSSSGLGELFLRFSEPDLLIRFSEPDRT